MRIYEVAGINYYHGSMTELSVGTILVPRMDDYEQDWIGTSFYSALEKYRPSNMLSHKESVFMVSNEDDVDLAGGGTEWLFTVKPIGIIQKHDINWSTEISTLIDDGYDINSSEVKRSAINYWNGIPHTDENVWEYLTPKAEIIKVERY